MKVDKDVDNAKYAEVDKIRARAYMCVTYPDSAPKDWRNRIADLHVKTVVSPLHDKDVNADGTAKKPHHHVVMVFEGVKSGKQVREMMEDFGGVVAPRKQEFQVNSIRGVMRYLCHLDNPEKARYSLEDVTVYGDFNYAEVIQSATETQAMMVDIMNFVRANDDIQNWNDFLDYAVQFQPLWYELACTKGLPQVQNAIYWKREAKRERIRRDFWEANGIDPDVAEALGYKPGGFIEKNGCGLND